MIDSEEKEMNIQINKKKNNQISKTTLIRQNYISNAIRTNSPNSNTNFLTTEDDHKKTEIEIKNENIEKRNDEDNNNKNEEIYFYFNAINNKINKTFDQQQILYFLLTRMDKDKTLICNIFYNNNFFILYSYSQKFILSSKENSSFFHKNFIIYTTREFTNSSIIAHLHSYSNKTEFILYDNGNNPPKSKNNINNNIKKNLRRYLLQIKFLNDKKFEHFLVYMPKDNYFVNNNYNIDINHKDKLSNLKNKEILIYENSMPKFDFYLQKFVDNFNNRVIEKSKNNFKIIYENKNAIECGKINDSNYILDISYPFSPLEAFAIAISVFAKNK